MMGEQGFDSSRSRISMAQCGFVPLRLRYRSLCVPDRNGRSRRPVGGADAGALSAIIRSADACRAAACAVGAVPDEPPGPIRQGDFM
jgi:hypothetical protein